MYLARPVEVDASATAPVAGPKAPRLRRDVEEQAADSHVDLAGYDNSWYHPGRNRLVRMLWHVVNVLVFINPLMPYYKPKRFLLRLFGAKVGKGVVIKPNVNFKYPWNMTIGDHTWIGERSWFDSLDKIDIGAHVCISQGVYLCTGSHNWKDPSFGLILKPITIEDGAWVGCQSTVTCGVTIGSHSVVAAGSVASKDTPAYMICRGNPAEPIKQRDMNVDPATQVASPEYRLVFPKPGEQRHAAIG
jgi:putative colanic acid biosynthesis acetyltransferase WcaF